MMIMEGKAANAIGGKTARACDSCLKKRARWFCAADDAFLCQACDTSVHSANQLASRHERVRLGTSSFKGIGSKVDESVAPTWHQGFTRKARTPRNTKPSLMVKEKANWLPLVPEISSDETYTYENEEQILCRVPVFEPFAAELCDELMSNELENMQADDGHDHDLDIPELVASDAELAEFAADVESLLGTGIDEDSFGMEEKEGLDVCFEDKRVKTEDQDDQEVQAVIACHFDPALDMARESSNWDFDYTSPMSGEEEEVKLITNDTPLKDSQSKEEEEERSMKFLKLNYETVITAWASQGSPWADGAKPEFNPDDYWPDFMGISPGEHHHPYGTGVGRINGRNEEREARVLRYREKRRTRLFSKKIRYEVRKLNAEKRPRMKGRFIKRSSFAGSFPLSL